MTPKVSSAPLAVVLPWMPTSNPVSRNCLDHISHHLATIPDDVEWQYENEYYESEITQNFATWAKFNDGQIKFRASDLSAATLPYALETINLEIPDIGFNAIIMDLDCLFIEFDPSNSVDTLNNIRNLAAPMPAAAINLLFDSYPGEAVLKSSARLVTTMRRMDKKSGEISDLSKRLPNIASLFVMPQSRSKTVAKLSIKRDTGLIRPDGLYFWEEPGTVSFMRDVAIAKKLADIYEKEWGVPSSDA